MAPPDTPLHLSSRVVRVQDAAEPYTVEIAIQLRAAPEEGQARRCRCRCRLRHDMRVRCLGYVSPHEC
jgi:hypothetical protein